MTKLARKRSHEDFLEETAALVNTNGPPDIQELKAVLAKHGLVPGDSARDLANPRAISPEPLTRRSSRS